MILSHRHRFIFLKTRKTGGTSVEIALSALCGPEDVITPISPEDEALRRELGFPGPQNCEIPARFRRASARARCWWHGRPYAFFNHAPAGWIRDHVEPEVWSSYFKFCFERNPYDKAISRYYWSTREASAPPSIASFLARAKRRQISNWHVYAIGGRVGVDFVGRFEHLREDLAASLARIGLPPLPSLPRAKSRYRRDTRHYSELLDASARARVERVCARELEAFGYPWEGVAAR